MAVTEDHAVYYCVAVCAYPVRTENGWWSALQPAASLLTGPQQRFDLWATDVIRRCHRAYRAKRKAQARQRHLLEAHVRREHNAYAAACIDLAEAKRLQPARPHDHWSVARAIAKRREHQARKVKTEGRLARHDRALKRARLAVEKREEEDVQAGRGKARKPPRKSEPPLTYMCDTGPSGAVTREYHGQHEVAAHLREQWSRVLNMDGWNQAEVQEEMDAELQHIERDGSAHIPQHLQQYLQTGAIFHVQNIRKAIKRLHRGSAPGIDKVSAELMLLMADNETFITHIQEVFLYWHEQGKMGDHSRIAVLTTLFKDKPGAERSDWKMYRPLSVTTMLYRVYGGCLEQSLAPSMKYIIGDSQVGHQRGRTIDENISLITESIRYINNDAPQAGGLLLMLDNEKAFDRVQWPFMLRCLQAFGIPDSFIRAVRTMYTDISTVIKTNAKLGTPFSVSSGIRQGCVLSALLYVITQEVQLRMIRRSAIRGIQIPGQDGRTDAGHTATVKERALVDDTLVLLRDARDLVELLRVIHAFQRISNHKMNFSKSILVLLGQFSQLDVADSDAPEACTLRDAMSECGLDAGKVCRLSDGEAVQVPKWHGVCIATEKGIEDQCAALADKAAAAATDIVAQQDARKNGARGRETAARWGVAAPVVYPLRYQVPHHTARLDGALDKIQKSMDKVATRGYHGTSNASRRQPRADGGYGHMDLKRHLRAHWHKLGLDVIRSADDRPYKNFYAYYVRRHMPQLGTGRAALASNLRFGPIRKLRAGQITGVAKQVFEALGTAPSIRPCPRFGTNKVHTHDVTPGVTGLRLSGRILYRATPLGQLSQQEQGVRGLRPTGWRAPGQEQPAAAMKRLVGGLEVVGHVWTSPS